MIIKKRLFSFALVFCLLASLLPVGKVLPWLRMTAHAADPLLTVGTTTINLSQADTYNIYGGTVSYNPATKTLTLNNVNITECSNNHNIYALNMGPLTVKGNATLSNTTTGASIFCSDSLTMDGNFQINSSNGAGIDSLNIISISGGRVTVTSKNPGLRAASIAISGGTVSITSKEKTAITDHLGGITISGGKVTAISESSEGTNVAISGTSIRLTGVQIITPTGGEVDGGTIKSGGTTAKNVVIEATTSHTVTYKVDPNSATWSDGSTSDKTESVIDGCNPSNVPTGMRASFNPSGYKASGTWYKRSSSGDDSYVGNPANETITSDTTFVYKFGFTKTEESLRKESIVYAGEIFVDGVSQMRYLYSADLSNNQQVFANLSTALNGTSFSGLVPSISGDSPNNGLAVSTSNQADMGPGWTSAASVAGMYFTGIVGTENNSNLYDANASYKRYIDDRHQEITESFDYPLSFDKRMDSHLSTTTDFVWVNNGNGGALIKAYTITAYAELTEVKYTCVNVTTATAAAVTNAPKARSLTYNGAAQEMVTAGAASGGTMQYALGTDAATAPTSGWSASLPTGTDSKNYFVWYMAKGDASHTDSVAACVTTTISPCSISGATVTLDKTEILHTGSEISVSVTSVKLGNTELTAKDYEVSGTTKATDKGTYTVTVTGKGNYKDTASAQWTITDGKAASQNADGQAQTEGFNTSVKIKQKLGKLIISWDKVAGVSKVEVYAAYCGKNFSSKPTKTTAGNKVTIKKLKGKELDFTRNFKLRLIAYDSNGKKIGKIPNPHFVGKDNEKYTNAKSIKLSKTQITISAGQSEKIKASIKREDKNKKLLPKKHVDKFRYRSTNSNVAKVDSNGNITGVSAGTCEVYVYAQNGLAKKVAVTVN